MNCAPEQLAHAVAGLGGLQRHFRMRLRVHAEDLVDEARADVVDAFEIEFGGGEQLQSRDDPACLCARVEREAVVGEQAQRHLGAAEVQRRFLGAEGPVGVGGPRGGVEREAHEHGGARALERVAAELHRLAAVAPLQHLAVGLQVHRVHHAGHEEEAAAAMALRLRRQPALGDLEGGALGIGQGGLGGELVEHAQAVVADQDVQVRGRLAHRHRHPRGRGVVDRVVEEFAEHVLRDAGHGRAQLQHRMHVAQPGRVLVQALDRVVGGHLALHAGLEVRPAVAVAFEPAVVDQPLELLGHGAARHRMAPGQHRAQVGGMRERVGGDRAGEGGEIDAGHQGLRAASGRRLTRHSFPDLEAAIPSNKAGKPAEFSR